MKRWFRRYSLSAGSAGYGAAMALVLALLLLASGVTPVARAQPEPPHQFYGNVYIGGSLAAAGTKVEARINGVKYETIVDSQHRYGYSPLFKVPGSTGTVTFYIGTTPTKAVQEVAWQSGGINRNDGQPLHLSDTAIDLTITTTSLPDGQVGTPYTPQTLQASGGATPYTWSLYSGSLPAGLSGPSASGVISGTPTVAETATFTVQVTDAVMATDTQSLSITIGTLPPPSGDGGRLIGADDAAGYNETANYIFLTPFQAVATGQITEFRLKAGVTSQVVVAIYADNAGEPGARLSYNNTAQNVVAGWNTLSIPALNITSGTYYWLGVVLKDNGAVQYIYSAVNFRYKRATFSGFTWPDPAGSSYYSGGGSELVAGWGGTVVSVAPAAPTRDCSALTFKWNAATGATKYHLQVNTNSGFTGTDMFNAEVVNVLYREVTGLTAGITYYWRVKAGNTADWSDWSSTGSIVCQ